MADLSVAEREKLYTEFLRVEGYRPDLEQDGKVEFTADDVIYSMPVTEDSDYFVIFTTLEQVTDPESRARAMHAANRATAEAKVAKVSINEHGVVYVTVSIFCVPPEGFKILFTRCLSALREGSRIFYEEFGLDFKA